MRYPKTSKLLAFDIGASSGRAILGHFDGERLNLEEIHRFPNGPVCVGENLYSDVLYIWSEIQLGLQKAAAQKSVDIVSIGLDAWGVDYALLDANNHLLANPYHYRDDRTADILAYTKTLVSFDEIYQQTGNVLIGFNTLFQLLASVRTERNLIDAAQSLLMLPDLFNFWLSGQRVSEFTVATTSQCYNPTDKDWAWGLLDQLCIPAHFFQRVIQPGTVIGTLQPWLSKQAGCKEIPIVLPACHDTGSAVVAVPATGKEFMYISSGTWSLVGVELKQPMISLQSLASGLTNEGGLGDRFRFLKITPGMWPLQQCRAEWKMQGKNYTYEDLTALAAAAPAFGSLICASAPELSAPGDIPAKIQAFCRKTGQLVPQTEGEIVRCVLESLALQYRLILLKIEAILGRSMEVVHIIGGGSRNRLMNALTANATGKTVIAGPVEATAAGNLLVQAMGLGLVSSLEDIRQVVSNSFSLEVFEPSQTTGWDDALERYQKICQ